MSFDLNKHVRAAGNPIQEDSASSKKAWQSRDRGSGQDPDDYSGAVTAYDHENPPDYSQKADPYGMYSADPSDIDDLAQNALSDAQHGSTDNVPILAQQAVESGMSSQDVLTLADEFASQGDIMTTEYLTQVATAMNYGQHDQDYSGNVGGLLDDMGIDPTQMTETVNEALDGIIRRNR